MGVGGEEFSLLNTFICSRSEARGYFYLLNKLHFFSSRVLVSSLLLTRIRKFVSYSIGLFSCASTVLKEQHVLLVFLNNTVVLLAVSFNFSQYVL